MVDNQKVLYNSNIPKPIKLTANMTSIGLTIAMKLWDTLNHYCGEFIPNLARIRAANEARKAGLIEAAKETIAANRDKFATGEWEFDFDKGIITRRPIQIETLGARVAIEHPLLRDHFGEIERRGRNLISVVRYADEEVRSEDGSPASEDPIDDDWFYRWREYASKVSSESLQRLWAKILVGEVRAPTSFSVRLLDFVHSLSPTEAKMIARMGPLLIGERWMINDPDVLKASGFASDDEIQLSGLGLISGIGGLYEMTLADKTKTTNAWRLRGGLIIRGKKKEGQRDYALRAVPLTNLGRELCRLLPNERPNDEALEAIKRMYAARNWDIEVIG